MDAFSSDHDVTDIQNLDACNQMMLIKQRRLQYLRLSAGPLKLITQPITLWDFMQADTRILDLSI